MSMSDIADIDVDVNAHLWCWYQTQQPGFETRNKQAGTVSRDFYAFFWLN
jgi:hypothetical protein